MKKMVALLIIGLFSASLSIASPEGGLLFQKYCAFCHPDGGNIITPEKTLDQKTLMANGIKSAEDIIAKMRKPGPGMTKFDDKAIPESEAREIAEYILTTFR